MYQIIIFGVKFAARNEANPIISTINVIHIIKMGQNDWGKLEHATRHVGTRQIYHWTITGRGEIALCIPYHTTPYHTISYHTIIT